MSFSEALDMGRYFGYVWGSFGVVAAGLLIEVILLRHRRRTIISRLGRIIRMKQREQQNNESTS